MVLRHADANVVLLQDMLRVGGFHCDQLNLNSHALTSRADKQWQCHLFQEPPCFAVKVLSYPNPGSKSAKNPFVLAQKMFHAVPEMRKALNGNGNGNGSGASGLLQTSRKQTPQPSANTTVSEPGKSQVSLQTAEGVELRGVPVRITRHQAIFEVYGPAAVPHLSEALQKFQIALNGRVVYSGRAVVGNLVDEGTKFVCEATLDETEWKDLNQILAMQQAGRIASEFKSFLSDWQKFYIVRPEFKIVVADMQSFLNELRLWLERVELGIQGLPVDKRTGFEKCVMEEVGRLVVPAFDALHERLESVSEKISEDLRPMHRLFAQRQLHSLTLCSPFARRAYEKPLGYAGDYEMVNMIALNPYKGNSLFAKIVNLWFLSQWPSKAHRNRLSYLKERLENETFRALSDHKKLRIFNFACGPAIEVQRFLADCQFSQHAELTLADFSQETLQHVAMAVKKIKQRLSLETSIQFLKKSVYQVLKERTAKSRDGLKYDFVYCAGLFDYLPDTTCRQLMEAFYDWLAPGGLLAVTNVINNKPFCHMLEFVLDWHLIYRNVNQAASIIPASIPEDARSIKIDPTGVNIFIEARKPRE